MFKDEASAIAESVSSTVVIIDIRRFDRLFCGYGSLACLCSFSPPVLKVPEVY